MDEIGFIILRHVNSQETNEYWKECYKCVRKYYPENKILIIDDNSNYNLITYEKLYKTLIINSEYPGRGELLPYYYYLQHKLFKTAVIIHDSVFINKYIDFTVDNYKFLWNFIHRWDQPHDETRMLKKFKDKELIKFHKNKSLWKGCFGAMAVIKHEYLVEINNKYNISILLDCVLNRFNRKSFERVIGCLLQKNSKNSKEETFFGRIGLYCPYNIKYKDKNRFTHLPMTKVWTGR